MSDPAAVLWLMLIAGTAWSAFEFHTYFERLAQGVIIITNVAIGVLLWKRR